MVEIIFDSELCSEVCPLCGTEVAPRATECEGCGVALEHPTTLTIAPHGF